MKQLFKIVFVSILIFASITNMSFAEDTDIKILITDMITAFSQSSKGIKDENFITKVKEIDENLRKSLERNGDLTPFKKLVKTADKFKDRKAARKMFEIVFEKAYKRLQFVKVQQDFTVTKKMNEDVKKLIAYIEKYLDPSLPDFDTVDRDSLEYKRKKLQSKIKRQHNKILTQDNGKKITVEVMDEEGNSSKLKGSRESNLLAKLKTVIPDPGKMIVKVKLKTNSMFDLEVYVQDFVAPNGFSVIKAELGFTDISLEAIDNSNETEVDDVLGNAHFNRYKIVQSEEQLNVMPKVGESAYEMGSFAPGQTWKMPLKKLSGISSIYKELEGNTDIAVLNKKTAKSDKAIVFKNNGSKNMIYLQGTDMTGLVSVKALGNLIPKKGIVTFREILLIVDDELSSDITRFIGEQGINWFLKKASTNLRKGLPFTPILENINMDRDDTGKMVYIFSGRGIVAR